MHACMRPSTGCSTPTGALGRQPRIMATGLPGLGQAPAAPLHAPRHHRAASSPPAVHRAGLGSAMPLLLSSTLCRNRAAAPLVPRRHRLRAQLTHGLPRLVVAAPSVAARSRACMAPAARIAARTRRLRHRHRPRRHLAASKMPRHVPGWAAAASATPSESGAPPCRAAAQPPPGCAAVVPMPRRAGLQHHATKDAALLAGCPLLLPRPCNAPPPPCWLQQAAQPCHFLPSPSNLLKSSCMHKIFG